MLDISLIVHTRNSARTLPKLLATTLWIKDRIVVDMTSVDGTHAIAKDAGCRIEVVPPSGPVDAIRNSFLGMAKHAWTLVLDSDEFLSADAEAGIAELIAEIESNFDAVSIPRFNYIGDHLMLASGWYPDNQIRLFRTGTVEWQPGNHRSPLVTTGADRTKRLEPPSCLHIHHTNYSDLFDFVSRQANYAVTDTYDHPFNFHAYLEAAYREFQYRHNADSDGDLSTALSILMSWDRIVRGVLHWERSGRPISLDSAFTIPIQVERPFPTQVEQSDAGELATLRQRIADYETSTSWRITRPLRWLAGRMGFTRK